MSTYKTGKKGAWIIGISFFLVLVIGISLLGYYTGGFRDWSFFEIKSNKNLQIVLTPQEGNSITFYAETVEGEADRCSQRVTATVYPDIGENIDLVWNLYFGEKVVSWDLDKFPGKQKIENFLVLKDTEEKNTKEIECLQEFGTQAIISAALRSDETIKGTCTVDYMQEFTGADLKMGVNVIDLYEKYPDMVEGDYGFTGEGLTSPYAYDWVLHTEQTETTITFPYAQDGDFRDSYAGIYTSKWDYIVRLSNEYADGAAKSELFSHSKGTFTLENEFEEEVNPISVEVAMTESYYSALAAARLPKATYTDMYEGTVESDFFKEENIGVFVSAIESNANIILGREEGISPRNILYRCYGLNVRTYENYVNLVNEIKKRESEPMVQMKISFQPTHGERVETVYQIKFDISGLNVAENITG